MQINAYIDKEDTKVLKEVHMNLVLIAVLVLLVFNVLHGYKKGFVKSLVSFISLIVLAVVLLLVTNAIHSYVDGKIINVIVVILLLAVVSFAHHIINFVLFPAKLLAKLPIVSWADQVLGIAFGLLQTLLIVWTGYIVLNIMDLGAVEQIIVSGTNDSRILSALYEHNYLRMIMENFLSSLK